MNEVVRNSVFVSAAGGMIDLVSGDGEVVMSLPVAAGVVSVNPFLDLIPYGGHIEVAEGIVCVPPRGPVVTPARYGKGSHESGANPDFQPTSASHMERKMMLLVDDLAQKSVARMVASQTAALSKIEVIPTAPKAEPPVTEGAVDGVE